MIDEIRAELLLSRLYPELDDKWVARHKGTFYRNYNADVMSVYPGENLVELSRDGFLKLLPDGYLSDDDELRHGNRAEQYARMKQRLHRLDEAFVPVDTQRFRTHLQLERAVTAILEMKLSYILRTYFDYDPSDYTHDGVANEYIAQVAPLLLCKAFLRGDIPLVRNIIAQVTGYDVDYTIRDYSDDDTTVYAMPMVTYTVTVDGLDAESFAALNGKMQEFFCFVSEHFLPFDQKNRLLITGNAQDTTLLQYNSRL